MQDICILFLGYEIKVFFSKNLNSAYKENNNSHYNF